VAGVERQAETVRCLLLTRHLQLTTHHFFANNFAAMRELHAFCAKISRARPAWKYGLVRFIGFSAYFSLGIELAKVNPNPGSQTARFW
jgi:hypothetical protein